MESYVIQSVSAFVCSALCLWDSSELLHIAGFVHSLCCIVVPCIHHSSFIHSIIKDIGNISSLGLLLTVSPSRFEYMSSGGHVCWGHAYWVGMLGHRLCIYSSVLGTATQFSQVFISSDSPTSSVWKFQSLHILAESGVMYFFISVCFLS